MLRTPQALVPYLVAFACMAAGGMWHAIDQLGPGRVLTIGTPQVGGPFALLDQNGETRTDADYRGRWMLIYFGYTNCPDVCPTTLTMMSQVMDKLGGRAARVVPIFITVDPDHDTPQLMKQYLSSFGPRFVGLTGPKSHIASVSTKYRVYARRVPQAGGGYAVDHSSVIYLMDPNGKFATNYDNSQGPDEIVADLKKRI